MPGRPSAKAVHGCSLDCPTLLCIASRTCYSRRWPWNAAIRRVRFGNGSTRFRASGYGVLLYTGSSDAEGTLGGLIQVGRRIHNSVRSALELGLLCSNDPVCAQHDPENRQEHRHLHGAACHGCVLTAETSCEQQNDFLDRALVVKTVEELGAELFSDAGW